MSQSEVEFIRRAQAGNADAFGHLYQMHIDAITRFVRRKVGELDEVENLTQVVFLKAWQAIARYRPDRAPFRAWLYRIASNTVIDHFRTRKDADDIDAHQWLPDEGALPEDRLLASERAEVVQRAVDSLRPNYRQVISLRFLEGYDYDEAAQMLEREVNSVRVTQFRALGALKKALSREPVLWLATLATALSLVLGSTVTVAADRSLPGDRLYGVKQSMESARLARADDAGDVALYLDFADRRLDEAGRLLAAGRTDDLTMAVNAYSQEVNHGLVSLTALVYAEPDNELTELTSSRLGAQQTRLAEISAAGDESSRAPVRQAQDATEQVMGEVEKLRKALPPPMQDRRPESNDGGQSNPPPASDEQPHRVPENPPVEHPVRASNQLPTGADQHMSQPVPQRQPAAIPAPPAQSTEDDDRPVPRVEADDNKPAPGTLSARNEAQPSTPARAPDDSVQPRDNNRDSNADQPARGADANDQGRVQDEGRGEPDGADHLDENRPQPDDGEETRPDGNRDSENEKSEGDPEDDERDRQTRDQQRNDSPSRNRDRDDDARRS